MTVKVCFIGPTAVGKTTIIRKLLGDTNPAEPTVGCVWHNVTSRRSSREMTLQIWDTAGSEHYLSLCSQYTREANVIFLTFAVNSPQSFQDLKLFTDQLAGVAPGCLLYLLGNKYDLIDECPNAVTPEQAEAYLDKLGQLDDNMLVPVSYNSISARTGLGIDSLFSDIADHPDLKFAQVPDGVPQPREQGPTGSDGCDC
jgi:small GTP-binding protein